MELLVRRSGGTAVSVLRRSPATLQVALYRSKKSRSKDAPPAAAVAKSPPRDRQQRPKPRSSASSASEPPASAPQPPADLEAQWAAMRARTAVVPPPVLPAATKREIQNRMRMRRLGLLNDDDDDGVDNAGDDRRPRQQQQSPLHLQKNKSERENDRPNTRRAVSEKSKQFTGMESAPDSVVEREFLIPDDPENSKALDVAVIGRPNAGKSSIMNRLLNVTVSAVSAKYNTTRDRVLGILTEKDRQVTFYDTPGIIKPKCVSRCGLAAECAFV